MKALISSFIVFIITLGCLCMNSTNKPINLNSASNTTNTTVSTQTPTTTTSAQASQIFLSFHDAVILSNCAVSAKFVSYIEYDTYVEYEFQVKDVLYGTAEKTIYVSSMKGESSVDTVNNSYNLEGHIYTKGDDYILIMDRVDSILYAHPQYGLSSDIYIPLKDINKSTTYGEPITELTGVTSVDEIKTILNNIKNTDDGSLDKYKYKPEKYSKSDKLTDIVPESDYILELKIDSLFAEGVVTIGNTYICDVINVLKGDNVVKNADGKIMVALLKNSVKVGETYIILLNGDDSSIYVQSSKKSVIPISDTKSIDEIKQILAP
ncbi:MAG: hypothetical protein FWC47_07975 [Oscillospiraceae bacterium]|nr:hypothetical protein [Oscillospiraceae bacterium]